MKCVWCEKKAAEEIKAPVYWELPSGLRAIEIQQTPSVQCGACSMLYQLDETVEKIEDQLLLINTDLVPNQITFTELMEIPRLLKRNYFRF
ncbi:YokU family protein [Alkalihalobacillus sp. 1P02AB]|uniref:YokU family protein n=1 Tax=Alkalihalobacillus sp. 1P02AB TaxID=3132260 RepID=UPI0039A73299